MGRLSDKVAIITGAASANGMGFSAARIMAGEGAKVMLTDLDGDGAKKRAAELGDCARGLKHDVSNEAEWAHVVAETVAAFGSLSIVVNNAGFAQLGDFRQLSRAAWDKHFAINVTGAFLGIQAAASALRQSGRGSVINISSISGIVGTPSSVGYSASKGGLRLMTKALAIDLAPDNIRVNSIHPGPIVTDMLTEAWKKNPEVKDVIEQGIPLKRMGKPDDVGYMVAFLASDETQFVTGAEFVIDGGLTAQ